MNCSSPLRLAILLATTALLLSAQARAQGACSLLADPNSSVGKNCPAATPSQGVARTGSSVSPLNAPTAAQGNGAQPGRGQFVCAVFDPTTGKCRTMRPNTKDYDDAVQTGVEAAMMGMQVQADALRRAQEMGLGVPGAQQPAMPAMGFPKTPYATQPPMLPAPAQAVAGQKAPGSFEQCVDALSTQVKRSTGRNPTDAQNVQIMMQCQ
jgi:hypothetical protein